MPALVAGIHILLTIARSEARGWPGQARPRRIGTSLARCIAPRMRSYSLTAGLKRSVDWSLPLTAV